MKLQDNVADSLHVGSFLKLASKQELESDKKLGLDGKSWLQTQSPMINQAKRRFLAAV
jgi:hypothetical protein